MNKPHVHAAVIKAWADGAQIQYKMEDSSHWRDFGDLISPSWSEKNYYRVKPETKTFRVALLMACSPPRPTPVAILDSKQEAYYREEGQFIKWLTEPIEYEV